MDVSGDQIAVAVLEEFANWPSKRKPQTRSDGLKEWVPLSGIVVEGRGGLTCLAAATGMKCLPQNKISQALGVTLHDWHAEILAIRAFNRFILEECHVVASSQNGYSDYIRLRGREEITESHFQSFALKDGIQLHMYCSEAPCGDASMELTMAAQEDSTPWSIPSHTDDWIESPPELLQGRSYFSDLGTIRRKPSRPDAPLSRSKSCSDKLALKQSTSLLSSLASLLISPENMYLKSLTLPSSQYSSIACDRAFSAGGRLAPLTEKGTGRSWSGGYAFRPFSIFTTSQEFLQSRRQVLQPGDSRIVPSNLASFSTQHGSGTLIGGTMQGRKQFCLKGASSVSKLQMWTLALEIARCLGAAPIEKGLRSQSYDELKNRLWLLDVRRKVKSDVRTVLGGRAGEAGWLRNVGGEDWSV